ncbi:MAG: ACT domain-containing protein [Chitinophagaceae bacterium]
MPGEINLAILLKSMKPVLNEGEYVFCSLADIAQINPIDIVCSFHEKEGVSVIIKKELADDLKLSYSFVASWITLTIHSSLEAIGLTAAFSKALSEENISCNVVAAFYHDHIFVAQKDAEKAMKVLQKFSKV